MVDWDPKENMGTLSYLRFKLGGWVEVETVPGWVKRTYRPPKKTEIPVDGSKEVLFTGNSLEYKVITKRLPQAEGTYTETEYRARIKDKSLHSPVIKLALSLVLVALVFVAGAFLSAAPSGVDNLSNNETSVIPSDSDNPSNDETGSAATSDHVNNPWNSETVSIATSSDGSKELEAATRQSVEYWNENGERFSQFEFEFSYTDDATNADIVIKPEDYPLMCDYTVSTEVIGCAPILDVDSTPDEQTVVQVVEDLPQPAARATVKHELGHVLGLEHSDEPQSLMSHDSRLTERQQSVIDSTNRRSIETSIEREINNYRERHGQRRLSGDRYLRQMARSRAEEIARSDNSGATVQPDDGMNLNCEIDLPGRSYLQGGVVQYYTTSLYSFIGTGYIDYSETEYTGSHRDAIQQTVAEWRSSNTRYAEHYNRHGVGVYLTNDGDFTAVRAVC